VGGRDRGRARDWSMSDVTNDFSVGGITPELFVRDLMLSLRFYERMLGFRVVRQTADFAVLPLGDAFVAAGRLRFISAIRRRPPERG
jgi:catechol-2,3-dioxygenase